MTIYVGMDDTDTLDSRGTGRLAREVAAFIAKKWPVSGVTRHQLYVHESIPFTSHNSCAVVHVETEGREAADELFALTEEVMLGDFIPGSDPGLAVAEDWQITPALIAYGRDAQSTVLNQNIARTLAKNLGIRLKGLGGTEDGVIGSLAGLGLAAMKSDGRYLLVGSIRSMTGPVSVEQVLAAGVDCVQTIDGELLTTGLIMEQEGKSVKPCPIGGKITLLVRRENGNILPIKRG
ncbi:hypothetical protein Mlab_0256 [Methanocorpusculum labreanum Z]|uniref:Uncharacterized protein n=2 Tax=Methanocorpusculum labreanum TaxID=83984 RepID=A2SQ26_METLZ|nr:hypothetical protein Mlab_0256 [Methanocorpusculum labreanum Z]